MGVFLTILWKRESFCSSERTKPISQIRLAMRWATLYDSYSNLNSLYNTPFRLETADFCLKRASSLFCQRAFAWSLTYLMVSSFYIRSNNPGILSFSSFAAADLLIVSLTDKFTAIFLEKYR